MYTSFFGLNEKPFAITPDPRYLFMSERHGEGLAHLLYGVTDSGGFIQLTGEVGTGKTTLVRTLLGQLPKEVDVALILNPQVTVLEFLQGISNELGLELPDDRNSPMAIIDALNRFLLKAHANGRRIILLVDEAQNLSEEVLEQLRLLTNLETAKQKLLQVILIGQPELRDVLGQNNLRQLAQRVTGRYHLEPLSKDEAARYIQHRMRVAGAVGEVFDEAAMREVHRLSEGIPRLMNVICDRALLGAYSGEQRRVDKATVRRAAAEVSGRSDASRSSRPALRWAGIFGLLAVTAAAGYGLALLNGAGKPGDVSGGELMTTAPESFPPADNPAATTVPVTAAVSTVPTVPTDDQTSLSDQLAANTLDSSSTTAVANLMARWNVNVSTGIQDACAEAEAAGLKCLRQRGSWSLLEQLDRPALITLTDSQGVRHDAVLHSLAGDTAELSFGDVAVAVPIAEIARLWFGQYLIVWRPSTGDGSAIVPGTRGPGVLWLRRSLAEIDGLEATSTDDYFDPALESRVRQFQRDNRLSVDGLAGEQTQIIINSRVSSANAPRLAAAAFSFAGSNEKP